MKKLFAILICAIMCVMLFSSCNTLNHEDIVDEKWSFNEEIHWKNITCTKDMCKFNIVTYPHIDENGDLFCEVCGYGEMIHQHKMIMVQTQDGHYICYTCACESNEVLQEHYDEDGDEKCDACGYKEFKPGPDYELICSETHHWWVYSGYGYIPTVVFGYEEHKDLDEDFCCDICGYTMQ